MIQRIQSVYLLLVIIISALLFLIPLFRLENAESVLTAQAISTSFSITTNSFLVILNCTTGGIAFISVFLYKNRTAQVKACNVNMIIICVVIGLLFYTADTLTNGMNQKIHYQAGTYLPLLQLLFTFLAIRSIKKDEELVRSADRLR
jgi:uncharacterized membrane-anchored protein YitT (DUF2179 family)